MVSPSEDIPKTYEEAVRTLARWHLEGLDAAEVYSFPDPAGETVRLVEVSPRFPASGEPYPFTFGRSKEFPFRSSVIQITPGEWRDVLSQRLALPAEWDVGSRQRVHLHDQ